MKTHDVQQGSCDWGILRSGKVTASNMDNLVSPTGKVRTGAMPTTYLHKVVTEAWLGGPLASMNTFDMMNGEILEDQARPAFTVETGLEVDRVGFITADDERIGCSPDGVITGKQIGLEIKCPLPNTHVGYILEGKLPESYVMQVQGSLWVTKFPKWFFFSYCRNMPPLLLEVLPDEEIQEAIGEAVEGFLARFDDAIAKLTELNGGVRPSARPQFQQPELKKPYVSETPT